MPVFKTSSSMGQNMLIQRLFRLDKFSNGRYFFSSCSLQATGMTPLMYAVKDNRTSILDRLIELGSDVGARNNVSSIFWTPAIICG